MAQVFDQIVTLDEVRIVNQTNLQIDFQLVFSDADFISVDPLALDRIEVLIEDSVFIDANLGTNVRQSNFLTEDLPRQIDLEFA